MILCNDTRRTGSKSLLIFVIFYRTQFFQLPQLPIPRNEPKMKLGPVQLKPIAVLLSNYARRTLNEGVRESMDPLSFEALDQYSGLVLYETKLPKINRDPALLHIDKLHDRAMVYVDRVGTYKSITNVNMIFTA